MRTSSKVRLIYNNNQETINTYRDSTRQVKYDYSQLMPADIVDIKHYRNLQMRNVSAYLDIGSVTVNIFCHLTGGRRSQGHIDTVTRGRNG